MSGLEGGNDEVTDHEELLTEGGASAGSLHAAALPNGAPMSAHAVISRPLQIPAMSAVMHSAQHDLQQQHQQHRLLQIQLLRQQLLQRQPSRQTPFSYDYTSLLGPTQPTPQQFNAWNAPAHELHQSLPFALPSQATQSYNSSTETNPLPTAARPSFGTSEEVPLASLFIASRAGLLEVKQESDDEKRPMMRNDRRREKTDKNEQSKTYELGTDQNKVDTICQEV